MKTKFTLNTSLPTLNEYIKAERTVLKKAGKKVVLTAGAKLKAENTDKCSYLILAQNVKLKDCLYDVEIDWYRTNKREDPDNIYFAVKFILDGLVKAKVLKNDGRKNIRKIYNNIDEENHNHNFCIIKMTEVC